MHDMQEGAFKLTIVADMKWLALDRQLHLYRGYQHQRYEECPPIRRPGNEKKDSVFNKMLDESSGDNRWNDDQGWRTLIKLLRGKEGRG